MFFHVKNVFIIFVCIVSSIIYAVFAAFRTDQEYASYIEYYQAYNFGLIGIHKFSVDDIRYYDKMQIVFESIFLIEMILCCITEYIDENHRSVKDIKKISKRYLDNGFIRDLIPLIPFNWFVHFKGSRYLMIIKSMRLVQAYQRLDTRIFFKQISLIFKKRLDKVCKDPSMADEVDNDHNHIIL